MAIDRNSLFVLFVEKEILKKVGEHSRGLIMNSTAGYGEGPKKTPETEPDSVSSSQSPQRIVESLSRLKLGR